MLKRLIGVVTVKDGWAVQSIGYQKYRPLGRVEVIVENLDRWQLDEILILSIDRSENNLGPDFELIDRIAVQRIMTPLCYLGGIRHADDAVKLVEAGADRVAMESLFLTNPEAADKVTQAIGKQAVIRAQTVFCEDNQTFAYDYREKNMLKNIAEMDFVSRSSSYSELLLIDYQNEGGRNSFNLEVLEAFKNKGLQLICFGGITEKQQVEALFAENDVSSVAVGNSLNYSELAHRNILKPNEVDAARAISFGSETRGARQW